MLDDAEGILRIQLPPDDRNYAALPSGEDGHFQQGFDEHRVDEVRFQSRRESGDELKDIPRRLNERIALDADTK